MTAYIKPTKIQIYVNTARKTMAQVKAETGCTHIINGGIYNMTSFVPYCHLKVDGKILAKDQYTYWGYGWNVNDITLSNDINAYPNYISCVCMVQGGKANTMYVNADMQGSRQRTAIGVMPDGRVVLYCSQDGKTPEELQAYFVSLGAESAIMLDGGGSSQCDFDGQALTSARTVHNFICFWSQKEGGITDKKLACLDAGHGADTANGSPDGTYKEQEFTLDMANRIKPLLERHGVDVLLTRTDGSNPSLAERVALANNAKADLFVSLHSNAAGNDGWYNASGLCVFANFPVGTVAANLLLDRMEEADVKIFGAGLFTTELYVLQNTDMAAYLVEYGFHTSQTDVPLLKSSAHRDKLAVATAKAILDHFGIAWQDALAEPESGKIYRVQLGAFTVRDNAQKLADELKSKGYSAFVTEAKLEVK